MKTYVWTWGGLSWISVQLKQMSDHPQLNKHRVPNQTRMEVQCLTLKNYNVLKINISHLLKINNDLNTFTMANAKCKVKHWWKGKCFFKALQLGDRTFCCYLEVDNAFTNLRLMFAVLASRFKKFTVWTNRHKGFAFKWKWGGKGQINTLALIKTGRERPRRTACVSPIGCQSEGHIMMSVAASPTLLVHYFRPLFSLFLCLQIDKPSIFTT